MIRMKLGRRSWFSAKKVTDPVKEARRKVGMKFGAYVRTRARTSLKKSRAVSPTGNPPSSHTGRIKQGILFAIDERTESVVIGPIAYRRRGRANLGDLEYGGMVGRMRYRARPFMVPAFQAEVKRVPSMWRDQVR